MTVIPHINSNVPANPDLHRDESGLNLASMDKAVDEIIDDSAKCCEDLYVSDLFSLLYLLLILCAPFLRGRKTSLSTKEELPSCNSQLIGIDGEMTTNP